MKCYTFLFCMTLDKSFEIAQILVFFKITVLIPGIDLLFRVGGHHIIWYWD